MPKTETEMPQVDEVKLETADEKAPQTDVEKPETAAEPEPMATREVIEESYPADVDKAEVMAVRSRSGNKNYWRGGQKFGQDWRVLNRSELEHDRDWTRIATDPMLEIRAVTLQKIESEAK